MKSKVLSFAILMILTQIAQGSGWVDGSCNSGTGTYTWDDGNRYEGECKDGTLNGQGVLFHNSGDRYEGTFEDGQYNGKGSLTWVSGNRYDNLGNVIADPKSIPGAVLMYVIGLANESAALDAAGVTIADDIPDGVPEVVDEGNQSGAAGPIELPVNVSLL